MDIKSVLSVRNWIAAQVQRTGSSVEISQGHEILTVHADIGYVVIDSAGVAFDTPLQCIAGCPRRHGDAVADAGFDLGSFFIVVPRHQLQRGKLSSRVVKAIDFGKRVQPGFAALLSHDATGPPARQRIVESLVGGPNRLLACEGHSRAIETQQITLPVVRGGGHHPGIAAFAQQVTESVVVLK